MGKDASTKQTGRDSFLGSCRGLGSFAGFVLFFLILFLLWRDTNVWAGFSESRELRNAAYAERIFEHSIFRTRVNTWSNLAYVFVGLYAVFISLHDRFKPRRDGDGYLVNTPAMGILYGVTCCYLGLGSGLFHASLTNLGQQLDVAAMYSPLVALMAINLGSWAPRIPAKTGAPTWPLLSVLVLIICILLFIYKWELSSSVVLPALILGVITMMAIDVIAGKRKRRIAWGAWAFVTLAAGVACRQLGVAGQFSGPDTLLQGHSFWHLFTAATLGSMYLYYRSESTAAVE